MREVYLSGKDILPFKNGFHWFLVMPVAYHNRIKVFYMCFIVRLGCHLPGIANFFNFFDSGVQLDGIYQVHLISECSQVCLYFLMPRKYSWITSKRTVFTCLICEFKILKCHDLARYIGTKIGIHARSGTAIKIPSTTNIFLAFITNDSVTL